MYSDCKCKVLSTIGPLIIAFDCFTGAWVTHFQVVHSHDKEYVLNYVAGELFFLDKVFWLSALALSPGELKNVSTGSQVLQTHLRNI